MTEEEKRENERDLVISMAEQVYSRQLMALCELQDVLTNAEITRISKRIQKELESKIF